MRHLNTQLIEAWLRKQGPLAKEDLASGARIKFFTLDRILKGVKNASELEQSAICQVTGLSKDNLFPTVESEEEAS